MHSELQYLHAPRAALGPQCKTPFSTQPPGSQSLGLPYNAHIIGLLLRPPTTHPHVQPPIHLPTHSSTHSVDQPLIYPSSQLTNHLSTHSSNHLSIHPSLHPNTHSNQPLTSHLHTHPSTTQVNTYLSKQPSKHPPISTHNPFTQSPIHPTINCMFVCLSSPVEGKFHENRSLCI